MTRQITLAVMTQVVGSPRDWASEIGNKNRERSRLPGNEKTSLCITSLLTIFNDKARLSCYYDDSNMAFQANQSYAGLQSCI